MRFSSCSIDSPSCWIVTRSLAISSSADLRASIRSGVVIIYFVSIFVVNLLFVLFDYRGAGV